MKFLLDTNIIVDIISKRDGYLDSLEIFKFCETGHVDGFVSATTVTDVIYILRKYISPDAVRESVRTLLMIVDVADVLKSDISSAFLSEMKDYEDAVQVSCAKRIKADYIVTHNLKDFDGSAVSVISPSYAVKLLSRF